MSEAFFSKLSELTKLIAISQCGTKRDFIDLACFLRQNPHVSLGGLLELLRRKYGKSNRAHLLRVTSSAGATLAGT